MPDGGDHQANGTRTAAVRADVCNPPISEGNRRRFYILGGSSPWSLPPEDAEPLASREADDGLKNIQVGS